MTEIYVETATWSGTAVGEYRVGDSLGAGGMAAVYRAQHVRTGSSVALKMLRTVDPTRSHRHAAMLRREYHTLSELVHPRIIDVYDFGEYDGVPYYTMELLDGTDLTDRAGIDWRRACGLIRDVASSLAILHSRGLVHRDVSTRNVRHTTDGRAKLFDFGAMQPMGPVKNVVGTPPFMAPEAVLMQSLDGRVDLFALGAVAYYLLTGRHAYPAKRIGDLRDAWRSRPLAPARVVPEIPKPLSELVVQLLVLDRAGRPASASEVFARLSAVGDLPQENIQHATRAYLTTPVLVGREAPLVSLRRTVLCFVRRVGCALVLRGPSGSGRSRMLDTCAMEAKLLGAHVARADATDATALPWGVARRLCRRLLELAPERAVRAARMNVDLLAHVVPELAEGTELPAFGEPPSRSQLIRALRDFILELCDGGKFALLIDDVDAIDEPSAALLVALAHKAMRCPLLIVATLDGSRLGDAVNSVQLLDKAAEKLDLEPLSQADTARLAASLFGGIASDHRVVQQIASAAQGNPHAAIAYAQFLVDRGIARYEHAGWTLPAELAPDQLPGTLADALLARLHVVSDDARELADALALADDDAVSLNDLPMLAAHGDMTRLFRALDQLVAERVLVADDDRYLFSQRLLAAVLRSRMSEQRRRQLSGRIAETTTDPTRRILHLLNAGNAEKAIATAEGLDLEALLPDLSLLERTLAAAEAINPPARVLHQLRAAVLSKASLVGGADRFHEITSTVLAQITRDSGLAAYDELIDVSEAERLQAALALTHKRFEATPQRDRVFDVREAITQLARLSGVLTSMSASAQDSSLLEMLPPLKPLAQLTPVLSVVERIVAVGHLVVAGRREECIELCQVILDRASAPDHAGLDDVQHRRTVLGLTFMLGLNYAAAGSRRAEDCATVLEADPEMRTNAWVLRAIMFLGRGNVDEWRRCHRRAELVQLQQRAEGRYVATTVGYALSGYALLGDQIGIKETLPGISRLAKLHPGWRVNLVYARAEYKRLSGDGQGALDLIAPVASSLTPGSHPAFCAVSASLVRALMACERFDDAVAQGRTALARLAEAGITDYVLELSNASALAMSAAGDYDGALSLLRQAVAEGTKRGLEGFALGVLYESQARIALALGDDALFEAALESCANEYDRAHNPRLTVRVTALLEEAKRDVPEARVQLASHRTDSQQAELQSRMVECVDQADRSRCALTVLLQSIDSEEGCLYGVHADGTVSLLAAMPTSYSSQSILQSLKDFVVVERALLASGSMGATMEVPAEDFETQTEDPAPVGISVGSADYMSDEQGRLLEPFAMVGEGEPQRLAAVLVRPVDAHSIVRPSPSLLSQVARELLARGDVVGLPLEM